MPSLPYSLLRIIFASTEVDEDGCRLWTGAIAQPSPAKPNGGGYGLIRDPFERKTKLVHRAVYIAIHGPIPAGMTVDHICHKPDLCPGGRCKHRRCVEPEHLEAVPQRTNNRRGHSVTAHNHKKTECPQGHPYDEANTYVDKTGRRHCRTCCRARTQRWYDKQGGREWHRNYHQTVRKPGT